MQTQQRRLERAANVPEKIARIDQRVNELLKADDAYRHRSALAEVEEQRASTKLSEAQELIGYLERRVGTSVTLLETTVKGRRDWLPTIPGDGKVRVIRPTQATAVASSMLAGPQPSNGTAASSRQPQPGVEASAEHRTGSAPSVSTPQRKFNGVRMRA